MRLCVCMCVSRACVSLCLCVCLCVSIYYIFACVACKEDFLVWRLLMQLLCDVADVFGEAEVVTAGRQIVLAAAAPEAHGYKDTHTHKHTHIHTYIYLRVCVVCTW
jgi:hypothetical protein